MNHLVDTITEITELIFEVKFDNLSGKMQILIDLFMSYAKTLDKKENLVFNSILVKLLDAYDSKDYLLFSDILNYEIKPIVINKENIDE